LYNPRALRPDRIAHLVSAATRLPLLAVPLFFAVGLASAGAGGLIWGLPAFLLLPAVFWARLRLERHTLAELALGALVGGGGTWLAFGLLV